MIRDHWAPWEFPVHSARYERNAIAWAPMVRYCRCEPRGGYGVSDSTRSAADRAPESENPTRPTYSDVPLPQWRSGWRLGVLTRVRELEALAAWVQGLPLEQDGEARDPLLSAVRGHLSAAWQAAARRSA